MNNRFLAGVGIAVLVVLFFAWSALYIVKPKQIAVVQRFGEIVDVRTEPGLYFKMPFSMFQMDSKYTLTSQLRRFDLDTMEVQVRGGRYYLVDAFLVYRIADARSFVEQGGSATSAQDSYNGVEKKLRSIFDDSLRAVYGIREFDAALSTERNAMMQEVRNQITPAAKGLGIEIVDVRIQRTDLSTEVSQQTFARMKQERLVEAERLTALGQIQRQTIEADADRQYTEIIATATKEGEILRGEGEAERAKLFAEAAGQNPDFFAFWRSMDAYQKLSDTSMIISPDSVFFQYFRSLSPEKAKVGTSSR